MKLVYTQENRFDVNTMCAYLESHGVPVFLKNEFASSIMGEVPFFDTWPEIWVADELFEQAQALVRLAQTLPTDTGEWVCASCGEENPGTFELCWSCSRPRKALNE